MHYITNVEAVHPLTLVEIAEDILHISFATIIEAWPRLVRGVVRIVLSRLSACPRWSYVASPIRRDVTSPSLGQLDWSSYIHTALLIGSVVLDRHPPLKLDHDWQELDGGLL